MRKIFTLVFFLCLSISWVNSQILWGGPNDPNSTFAGGFNGWTTQGLSSEDPAKADSAKWYFSAAASAAGGAYYGTRGAINSTSRANGAMVFNSDLLDNAGIAGNFKMGKCPAVHSGVLVSPVINCSTFNSTALKFNQYYRNFESTCFVDVSNDGVNWTPFALNTDIAVNAETATNSQVVIDISSVAANQATVQVRFRFEGEYYFWIVDDVQIIGVPGYDLALNSHFYTPAAYRQPKHMICTDTFVFSANLNNKGSQAQTDVVLRGEILGIDRKTVLFSDSVIIDRLETTDDDTSYRTDNFFVPNTLDFGKYFIRWTVYSKSATGADFNTRDNSRVDSFEVSLNEFAKAPRSTGGVRAGSGAGYVFGCQYRTSDCWNDQDKWIARQAKFQLVSNAGGTLDGYSVSVYLMKVKDDVDAGFTNFESSGGIASTSIDILSAESWTGTTEQNYDEITVDLTDFNTGDNGILLAKKSRYFIGADHLPTPSGAVPVFHAISNEKSYNSQVFSTFVIDQAGEWFNGFQGTNTPIMELILEFVVKTDDTPLPSTVMSLYPNPVVNDNLKVGLNFDKATDANLTIADINGKILGFESHKAVTKDIFSISTSDLKAGSYLIRVSTDEGTSTKQFTVIK
ncbi:MAG: T9SS type A sorting domain-containing protein [Saprospiraceae bacterium]|nr:T9SS type A sorting domain-containing protein [Saprospiraceae bacterium]MBK8451531.1 T9SS type A sorting domain-containing protein [Saprospiraceae bacterium]MBK9220995.1 T9SS type A sorting domain-containing protein [Saprospiraceae bacterium]MBK9729182.1 T9SS type A sorting domain-containing protein [Saprospiraceae bacterium]